jgi:hypothetical protein
MGRSTLIIASISALVATAAASRIALGRLPWDAAAISFLQNRRDPGYTYQARVSKEHPVKVTQECADPGGAYTRTELVSPAGGLWLHTDIGERLVPGRRLSESHTEQGYNGSRSATWNLAPRR